MAAAAATRQGAIFLHWARFPYFVVEEKEDRYVVRMGDARYTLVPGQGFGGLTVEVSRSGYTSESRAMHTSETFGTIRQAAHGRSRKGSTMNTKRLKKPLFLSRETLVDLTPALQEQVRGGGDDLCSGITNYRLPRPSFDPCSPIL